MIRTYRRKLILKPAQEARLSSWIGACRVVYNLALEVRIAHYKATGKTIHKYELEKQANDMKKDVGWMADVPAEALSDAVFRLDRSYQRFFKGAGFPKWAKKRKYKSISLRQGVRANSTQVRIPKIGIIKIFKDAEIFGYIKNIRIIEEVSGYFACIQCDNVSPKFESDNQAIGLDMGISHFTVDSDGQFIGNPKHFKKYERKLRIENRSLARKKKGSGSWKKQARKLSLLHHQISNVRKDFLHKESTKIAKANNLVVVEDLNVSGMIKGRLAKQISDAGWATFRTMLAYKTTVIAVNPKFTSQTCSNCGAKDKVSRISQAKFKCTGCGHEANADHNAALNILGKGIAEVRKREALA